MISDWAGVEKDAPIRELVCSCGVEFKTKVRNRRFCQRCRVARAGNSLSVFKLYSLDEMYERIAAEMEANGAQRLSSADVRVKQPYNWFEDDGD